MTLLATPDQLANRLQIPPDQLDPDQAAQALTDASGMVRAIARQQFDFVSQETVLLDGGTRVLTLPQRPVVVDDANPLTVVEASYFGSVEVAMVEGRDFERLGDQLTRGYPWWSSQRLMGWPYRYPLGAWAPKVRVTYSHGYQVIPDDVVAVVLDVAQTIMTNPAGLRAEQIDDYNVTYAAETLGAGMVRDIAQKLGVTGRSSRSRAFSVRLG